MNLSEFYNYKNKLMEEIITNESIVNLINSNISFSEAYKLAYTQVFPYEYVPSTVEEGKVIVCFDVDILSVSSKTFLSPVLHIWIFAHKSVLRLSQGGLLPDELASQICEMINGSRFYGLGELNLSSVKRFAPMTDYQGKVLNFYATDFNRKSPTNKTLPATRPPEDD